MAMLADSRRRKRYYLQPRGKPLYENEDHFGKKMLEKMGWSVGKGLGAKEDGIKEFVKVHYKNDAQGLGYTERDDQWTQHEEHFTGLLKVLNEVNVAAIQDNNTAENVEENERDSKWNDIMVNGTMGFGFQTFQQHERVNANSSIQNESMQAELKKQISGISLEEMSKQSKARVHYKKFTKGKDLTQYSEKDLANIFGKKATEICENNITRIKMKNNDQNSKQHNNNFNDCIQTIESSLPINEYFNERLNKKLKHKNNAMNNNQMASHESSMEVVVTQNDKYDLINTDVMKKRKKKRINEATTNNCDQYDSDNTKTLDETSKLQVTDPHFSNINHHDEGNDQMNKQKKNKKRKHSKNNDEKDNDKKENIFATNTSEITEESIPIKKEKKRSKKNTDETGNHRTPQSFGNNDNKENESKSKDFKQDVNDYDKNDIVKKVQKRQNKQVTENHESSKFDDKGDVSEKQKVKKKNKAKKIKNTEPIQLNANNELHKEELPATCIEKLEVSSESLVNVRNNTKKRKLNNTNDLDNLLEVKVKENDEPVLSDCGSSKRKKKKLHNKDLNKHVTSMSMQTMEICEQKSSSSLSDMPDDKNLETTNNTLLSLEELKAKYDTYNQFTISSFCAEKFRNVDAGQFPGASLIQLNGYALNDETQLNVQYIQNDDERITNLWKCILDKYEGLEKPKKTYRTYLKEVYKARIHDQKKPKLHIKTWKRKNVFCAL